MVTAVPITDVRTGTRSTVLADYVELLKPRVTLMVVITAAAGFYLGCLRSGISPFNLQFAETLAGMAAVTGGSSTLNQVLERRTDALMPRTARRPMAARRLSFAHGLLFGLLAVGTGSVFLALTTNPITGMLTLLTAIGYVAIYTPLKRISMIATFVGAFPGAMPPLIGWTASRGRIEWAAVALFAILFVWQFPHFEAIGWLYRHDYARAGIRVTAVASPGGRATAAQALFYAVLMLPVSLWPVYLGIAGRPYGVVALILGGVYLVYTLRFTRITRDLEPVQSRTIARNLLKVSVMYLPLLLLTMMLNSKGRIFY